MIHIYKILPYIFIALIALPLPLLIFGGPLMDIYNGVVNFIMYRVMRRRHNENVNKFHEKPFALGEKELSDLFPHLNPGHSDALDYSAEEENW